MYHFMHVSVFHNVITFLSNFSVSRNQRAHAEDFGLQLQSGSLTNTQAAHTDPLRHRVMVV